MCSRGPKEAETRVAACERTYGTWPDSPWNSDINMEKKSITSEVGRDKILRVLEFV